MSELEKTKELKKVKVGGTLPQLIKPYQLYSISNWLIIAILFISNSVLSVVVVFENPRSLIGPSGH